MRVNDFTAARPGVTALYEAASAGQAETVAALLAAGAAVDQAKNNGASWARSHCRFVLTLMHFIPDSLTYSVYLYF